MKNCKRAKITVKKFIIKKVNSEEVRFFYFTLRVCGRAGAVLVLQAERKKNYV